MEQNSNHLRATFIGKEIAVQLTVRPGVEVYIRVPFRARGAIFEWLESSSVMRKVAGSSPARAKRLKNSHCPPSSEWVAD